MTDSFTRTHSACFLQKDSLVCRKVHQPNSLSTTWWHHNAAHTIVRRLALLVTLAVWRVPESLAPLWPAQPNRTQQNTTRTVRVIFNVLNNHNFSDPLFTSLQGAFNPFSGHFNRHPCLSDCFPIRLQRVSPSNHHTAAQARPVQTVCALQSSFQAASLSSKLD